VPAFRGWLASPARATTTALVTDQEGLPGVPKTLPKLAVDLAARAEARRRCRLSHAHVQMARELGLNPAKLGKINNHRQEPWKAPLTAFIEQLYAERFGRVRPETIRTLEQISSDRQAKKAAKKAAKMQRTSTAPPKTVSTTAPSGTHAHPQTSNTEPSS